MKKEWLLLITTVAVTLLLSLGLIRWFAPQLLGVPISLQLVKVSKEVPPFYEGVFRPEDYNSREFQLNDPYSEVRAKPLIQELWENMFVGPHDILGFRNRSVPNVADIIAIGDSQTYGNNVLLEDNWPTQLLKNLKAKHSLYNMSAGGWGAIQYFDMFDKAMLLQPRIIIVAFYTGNDPLESFLLAYNIDRWKSLRTDPGLDSTDAPAVKFPPPESEWWPVKFKDGTETIFTPRLRLVSNQEHPAIHAGYGIMKKVAHQMSIKAQPSNIKIIFTIIPTKELVYLEKIRQDGIPPIEDYIALINSEEKNLTTLASELNKLPNSIYVDLLSPLQQAALNSIPLYPSNPDGHPINTGYSIIAETLAPVVERYLQERPRGLFELEVPSESNKARLIILINNEGVWLFDSNEVIKANGWQLDEAKTLRYRDIADIPIRGTVTTIDPVRFGPRSIELN